MYGNATEGQHMANVTVSGADPGTFSVTVKFINDSAVQSSGSLRLAGNWCSQAAAAAAATLFFVLYFMLATYIVCISLC